MSEELKKFRLKDFFEFVSYPIVGVFFFIAFCGLYTALSLIIGLPSMLTIASMPTSPPSQVYYIIMTVIANLILASPVLIYGLDGKGFTWESVGLKPIVINWKRIGQIAIIAVSLVLFEILVMLVLEYFKIGIPRFSKLSPLETIVSNNFFLFLIFVFFLGILEPILEEIYFRGFIYGWLRKYCKPWVGILISALFFGFVHYKSWFTMVFAFLFGVAAAYLYERDKTLVSPIALHICVNIVVFFINFYIP